VLLEEVFGILMLLLVTIWDAENCEGYSEPAAPTNPSTIIINIKILSRFIFNQSFGSGRQIYKKTILV